MKSGGPLKRKTPMKRVNPERAAKRRELRESEGPLTKAEWELAVHRLDRGLCCVTGERVRGGSENYHHVVPKRLLRDDGKRRVVWHPDNGMTVTGHVHANHEGAHKRIARADIPERCIRFAAEHGYSDYVERTYP